MGYIWHYYINKIIAHIFFGIGIALNSITKGYDLYFNNIYMKRILAVDDNKDILNVLRYILEDSGYEVDTLSDGHFLFDKIKQHTPDLILLDIMLGDMDGRVLCKDVKTSEATHSIPVILISANHN